MNNEYYYGMNIVWNSRFYAFTFYGMLENQWCDDVMDLFIETKQGENVCPSYASAQGGREQY